MSTHMSTQKPKYECLQQFYSLLSKPEPTQLEWTIPRGEWLNKLVHTYHGILFSNKKAQLIHSTI